MPQACMIRLLTRTTGACAFALLWPVFLLLWILRLLYETPNKHPDLITVIYMSLSSAKESRFLFQINSRHVDEVSI